MTLQELYDRLGFLLKTKMVDHQDEVFIAYGGGFHVVSDLHTLGRPTKPVQSLGIPIAIGRKM